MGSGPIVPSSSESNRIFAMKPAGERVLVVGAGLAGLSAARELANKGYEVVVVEVRDRVGGRIHTSLLGGVPVDMGAAFIHGVDDNPVAALADDLGLTLIPMDNCRLATGEEKLEETLDNRIQKLWNSVLDKCAWHGLGGTNGTEGGETAAAGNEGVEANGTEGKTTEHRRVRDIEGWSGRGGGSRRQHGRRKEHLLPQKSAEEVSLGQVLQEVAQGHLDGFSREERNIWEWHRGNLELSCAADLQELSHLHWNQDDVYDFDGEHVMIKEGYASLSVAVAETLDIRLNTEVKAIHMDEHRARVDVTVVTGQKTSSMRADYVIVTLPLGVLKNRLVSFTPDLPRAKLDAIRSMGMGTLNKVALLFQSVFWDQVDFLGHVGEDRSKWLLFVDMSRITGQPILVGMTGGPFAVFIERLTDSKVVERAMSVIRTMYPLALAPLASEVTRWKRDRHARGSFSFIPPGCSAAEYEALSEPLCDAEGIPRVLFAGEATTPFHPSTVHGAWLTGLREAARLDMYARPLLGSKGRRGKRRSSNSFSPDVMYMSSVMYSAPTTSGARARRASARAKLRQIVGPAKQKQTIVDYRKVKKRASFGLEGDNLRRSPRLQAMDTYGDEQDRKSLDHRRLLDSLCSLPYGPKRSAGNGGLESGTDQARGIAAPTLRAFEPQVPAVKTLGGQHDAPANGSSEGGVKVPQCARSESVITPSAVRQLSEHNRPDCDVESQGGLGSSQLPNKAGQTLSVGVACACQLSTCEGKRQRFG